MHKFLNHTIVEKLVPMGNPEWEKPNSNTKVPRIDILKKLIKDGKPIELAKGGSFVVSDPEEAIKVIDAYVKADYKVGFTLNATDGKVYKNTQIGKSKVFGGAGGGAGGGTANTKLTESHNALMIAAMLEHGSSHDESFFTPDILKAAAKGVDVDEKLDKMLTLEGPWFSSSYNIAKLLCEKGYVKKGMKIYRGTKGMANIYAGKDIAFKNTGFKPLKDDKWNPGDIWAIDKSFSLKELKTANITAYNKSLLEHFNTRRLVGISLKGPETKYPPPLKEYNNQVPPDVDMHKYKGVKLEADRGTASYWSAKSASIFYDGGVMVMRDGTPGGSIKAEIMGKNARGGGISWGPMKDYVQRETRKKLPEHASGIKKMAINIVKGKEREIKAYYVMFNHFYKNTSYDEFKKELSKKDKNWISAKLASTYVCYYLDKAGGNVANALVTHFVNYAGSKGTESAVYVKVGK